VIWNILDFILHETLLQLRRERLIAIATISTVAVLMMLLGAILLFLFDVNLNTNRILGEMEIWACFDEGVPREQAEAEVEKVGKWPSVRSARFVPKEEGMKWLRTQLPSSEALKAIGNPLPDGVRVRVKDPKELAPVAQRLERLDAIASVVRSDDVFHRAVRLKRAITWVTAIVCLLVAVAGAFIVHNTIRLSLHARWREIYIMQLVGATRATTAAPFLLEGAVHGLLGAALAACVLIPIHMYLASIAAGPPGVVVLAPDETMIRFAAALLVSGAVLGMVGAGLSIRRHLRHRREWQP